MKKTKCNEINDVIQIFEDAENTNYQLTCDVNDFEPQLLQLNQEIIDVQLDIENVQAQHLKT